MATGQILEPASRLERSLRRRARYCVRHGSRSKTVYRRHGRMRQCAISAVLLNVERSGAVSGSFAISAAMALDASFMKILRFPIRFTDTTERYCEKGS